MGTKKQTYAGVEPGPFLEWFKKNQGRLYGMPRIKALELAWKEAHATAPVQPAQ